MGSRKRARKGIGQQQTCRAARPARLRVAPIPALLVWGLALLLSSSAVDGRGRPAHAAPETMLPGTAAPAAGTPQQAPPDTIRFEHLSVADGLSRGLVTSIWQDQRGLLWFGTEYGLNKYDGYQFTVYLPDPNDPGTLSSPIVTTIRSDRAGALWVGTEVGLDRYDYATGTFVRYQHDPDRPETLSAGSILSIYEDGQGTLWVGTRTGLNRYNPDSDTFTRYLRNLNILAMLEDHEGELWLGTNVGLTRFDRATGRPTYYSHTHNPQSLSHNLVLSLCEDHQGELWVGTAWGLNRFDRASGTFTRYLHDPQEASSLSADWVQALLEDGAGRLWVGTTAGLDLLDRDEAQFRHYRYDASDPQSLSHDIVLSLYEDRSGILWVGTASGVDKIGWRPERFKSYPQAQAGAAGEASLPGLSDNTVLAVYEDRQGVLWVGTFKGGLNRLDRESGVVTTYQNDPDNPASIMSNDVRAIYQDSAGLFWVGTSGGLYQFDPGAERFVHQQELGWYQVQTISEDGAGNLWIGSYAGLYRWDRATESFSRSLSVDSADPGGLSDLVWAAEDREGLLWIGSPGAGIFLWNPEEGVFTRHYQHDPADPDSMGSDTVYSLYEDLEGILWIGTYGGGLSRLDRAAQTFTTYTEEDGLPGNMVLCILADDQGSLWLGTNKGLSRFDPESETFHNYDVRDGLQAGEFWACARGARGEMFFGGIEGLNSFFPQQIQDNPHVPPIVITELIKFNQTARTDLYPGERIKLPYRENYLSFEFAALDYTEPSKNQYAYKMEGIDEDWVYARARRRVDYPNLRPGRYVFQVKGSNNDGVWNEEGTSLYITIRPPFWSTWWFWGFAALALVGGAYGGYRLRVRGLELRSQELGRQVQERTREIERRRQELEALYRADEELYRHLHMEQLLQALVDTAVDILGADKGVLLVWDEPREFLVVRAARGFQPETLRRMYIKPGQGVAGQVAVTGEPAIVEDTREDPRLLPSIIEPEGIRALMQVPLSIGGEVFGVFSADYVQPRSFSQEEQRLLAALAQRAALAIENAQLYEQAQALAVVQERTRLARELHDSVTQSLYSSTLLAEAGQRLARAGDLERTRDYLAQLGEITLQALRELRLLVYELRPTTLSKEGLVGILQRRLDTVERRAGIKARLLVEGEGELSPAVEDALYRISQEALNNALKHAAPTTVAVNIRYARGYVELEVVDDGRGFDPQAVGEEGGMGLITIRERVEKLGGTLLVRSAPGEGTAVSVRVARHG